MMENIVIINGKNMIGNVGLQKVPEVANMQYVAQTGMLVAECWHSVD